VLVVIFYECLSEGINSSLTKQQRQSVNLSVPSSEVKIPLTSEVGTNKLCRNFGK